MVSNKRTRNAELESHADLPTDSELFAIMRAHLLHTQLEAAVKLAKTSKNPLLADTNLLSKDNPYILELARFYRENLALSRLLDTSDLLIHAEGPAAQHDSPRLNAFNWLCSKAESQLKNMALSLMPAEPSIKRASTKQLDFRLTGLAPGSLYVGFALAGMTDTTSAPLSKDDDDATLELLRDSIHTLPIVPQFVGTNTVSKEIMDALPDPAVRDAAMLAAFELAPSGQRGIHTVQISAPRAKDQAAHEAQELGQKQRVVLKEVLNAEPMMKHTKEGSFTGILRGVDLDTGRIVLRQVSEEISMLRGVVTSTSPEALKPMLDHVVKVSGQYEEGAFGTPRLMRIKHIEQIQKTLT